MAKNVVIIMIKTVCHEISSTAEISYMDLTFDCLAASNWPPGHPRSDHHVSNPHRPDYY